jgi:predicted kinase
MPISKTLYIVRGVPGSGKTTFCKNQLGVKPYEADDFFMINGKYCYDRKKIKMAHYFCRQNVKQALKKGNPIVAVANTFVKKFMLEKYIQMAKTYGYRVEIIIMKGNYENVHNVSPEIIQRMKNDFQF